MSERCPTCGQGLPDPDAPVIDALANTLSFRGKTVRMQNVTLRLAKQLIDVMPDHVEREQIQRATWPHLKYVGRRNVEAQVLRLRAAIEDMGLEIVTIKGVGYRMRQLRP